MKAAIRCSWCMAQTIPLNSAAMPDDPAWSQLDAMLSALPDAWTLLRDRRIGSPEGPCVSFVLVHPEIGIALVALEPEDPEPARIALQAYLARERFPEYYPGTLPIVGTSIAAEDLEAVGERLAEAFEG